MGKAAEVSGGWLFKQEPTCYSYADLERDGTTMWDGVNNNQARLFLRKVKAGDRVLYYHTGKEKAIVGEMVAVEDAKPDPASDDAKSVVVRIQAVRRLPSPVSLATIKKEPALADWELVKLSRLSVMPVTMAQWQKIEDLASQ